MVRSLLSLLTALCLISIAGCLTLEVGIERTPTPDQAAVGTLASLMVEGTRWAYHATQVALPPSPTPNFATVRGSICYPGQGIPAMTLHFLNLENNRLVKLPVNENQNSYSIELPEGYYYAYAWVDRYQVGGIYTRAVPCGLDDSCTDHTPLSFSAIPGQVLNDIDLCDWVFPIESLPGPAGE